MYSNLLLSMPAGSEWILVLAFVGIALAFLGFWIYSIIDIVRNKFNDDTTKIVWLLVVIFTGIIGSIIYWIFGRPARKLVNN